MVSNAGDSGARKCGRCNLCLNLLPLFEQLTNLETVLYTSSAMRCKTFEVYRTFSVNLFVQ